MQCSNESVFLWLRGARIKGTKIPKRLLFVTGRRDISTYTSPTPPWRPFICPLVPPGAPVIYMPTAINLEGSFSKLPVIAFLSFFFFDHLLFPRFFFVFFFAIRLYKTSDHGALNFPSPTRSRDCPPRSRCFFAKKRKNFLSSATFPPNRKPSQAPSVVTPYYFTPPRSLAICACTARHKNASASPCLYTFPSFFFFSFVKVKETSKGKEIRDGEITKSEGEIITQGGFFSPLRILAIIDPWLL